LVGNDVAVHPAFTQKLAADLGAVIGRLVVGHEDLDVLTRVSLVVDAFESFPQPRRSVVHGNHYANLHLRASLCAVTGMGVNPGKALQKRGRLAPQPSPAQDTELTRPGNLAVAPIALARGTRSADEPQAARPYAKSASVAPALRKSPRSFLNSF